VSSAAFSACCLLIALSISCYRWNDEAEMDEFGNAEKQELLDDLTNMD